MFCCWPRPTTTTRGNMLGICPSILKKKTGVRSSVLIIVQVIHFSCGAGERPAGGSVHLLWHGYVWWDWEGWEGFVLEPSLFRQSQLILSEIYLKVTMEAQLGLIGGTMGLLTGFSILSGVEIIYYLLRFLWFSVINSNLAMFINFYSLRFFMSLKTSRTDVVSAVKKRFENHLTRKD